jgi:hypothetical protein
MKIKHYLDYYLALKSVRLIGQRIGPQHWSFLRAVLVTAGCGVAARAFYTVYFPLTDARIGGPGDFGPYAAIDWIGVHWFLQTGEIPRWNPLIRYGVPYIGDAYISFFNVFASIPFGLYGPIAGAKIAVVVAVALAGIGQYVLARTLGQHWVTAAFSSGLAIAAGSLHVPVGTGFAFGATLQHGWIAFTLASALRLVRSPSPQNIVSYALSSAFLFHSGNMYYWLGSEFIVGLIHLQFLIRNRRHILVRDSESFAIFIRIVLANVLVVALWAPQLLPAIDLRSFTQKPIDVTRKGTLPILVNLFGLMVQDRQFWANGLFGATALGWAVHYSYVGATCLVFAPIGFRNSIFRHNTGLRIMIIGFISMILLASLHQSFIAPLVSIIPSLELFRHWGTVIAVATVCLIPIVAEGLETIWKGKQGEHQWFARYLPNIEFEWSTPAKETDKPSNSRIFRVNVSPALTRVLVAAFAIGSLTDPWEVNRGIPQTTPRNVGEEEVFEWVRANSDGPTLAYAHDLIYSHANPEQLRRNIVAVDSVWPFQLSKARLRQPDELAQIVARPQFAVTFGNRQSVPDAELVAQFAAGRVWKMKQTLPFAFIAGDAGLARVSSGPVFGSDRDYVGWLAPANVTFEAPHRMAISITPALEFRLPVGVKDLIIFQGWMPSWHGVTSSGRVVRVSAAGEFIRVHDVQEGDNIVLEYDPLSWKIGSGFGLVGAVVVVLLLGGSIVPFVTRFQNRPVVTASAR